MTNDQLKIYQKYNREEDLYWIKRVKTRKLERKVYIPVDTSFYNNTVLAVLGLFETIEIIGFN